MFSFPVAALEGEVRYREHTLLCHPTNRSSSQARINMNYSGFVLQCEGSRELSLHCLYNKAERRTVNVTD